jgi:uronate dehydrogenase
VTKTIVITGAGGVVGRAIRPLLRTDHRLRLFDRNAIADLGDNEEAIVGDIADKTALAELFHGASAVVHLAGCTTEAVIEEQIAGNVQGAWNVFDAARAAGVERVVFTSSHHVVGHYPRHRRLGSEVLLRPDSRYGLTKAFGEQAGAFYADQFGLRVLAIRVGFLGERPIDRRRLAIWTSPRDLVQLIRIGLTHEALRFAVVYGVSDNSRSFFDNAVARRLGYRPQDSADDHAEAVTAVVPPEDPDRLASRVIGGAMAEASFVGDIARIEDW